MLKVRDINKDLKIVEIYGEENQLSRKKTKKLAERFTKELLSTVANEETAEVVNKAFRDCIKYPTKDYMETYRVREISNVEIEEDNRIGVAYLVFNDYENSCAAFNNKAIRLFHKISREWDNIYKYKGKLDRKGLDALYRLLEECTNDNCGRDIDLFREYEQVEEIALSQIAYNLDVIRVRDYKTIYAINYNGKIYTNHEDYEKVINIDLVVDGSTSEAKEKKANRLKESNLAEYWYIDLSNRTIELFLRKANGDFESKTDKLGGGYTNFYRDAIATSRICMPFQQLFVVGY